MATLTDRIAVIVSASTQGATQEFQKLEKSAKKTQTAADKMGAAFGVSGKTLAAGVAAGAAAIVGTGLIRFLEDSVQAYGDSAKAAGDLAAATGSSAETVSRMTAALQDAGVSADTTATLLTKFTTNFGKNVDLIEQLGVAVVKNKDGTTDYAATMVAVVDAVDALGDASQRNAALVKLFGKQGAQAFQDLHASGVKLSEAMRLIDKYRVFTAEDVKRAAAYDDAMDSLHASVQGLQFSMGSALVPVISEAASALAGLLDVGSGVVSVLDDMHLTAGLIDFSKAAITVAALAAAINVAKSAWVAFTATVAANPVGAALVAMTVAVVAFHNAVQRSAKDAAAAYDTLVQQIDPVTGQLKSASEAADALADALGKNGVAKAFEQVGVSSSELMKGISGSSDEFDRFVQATVDAARANGATESTAQELVSRMNQLRGAYEGAAAEAGTYAVQTQLAKVSQDALLDMILSGKRGTEEYGTALTSLKTSTAETSAAQAQLKEDLAGVVTNFADFLDLQDELLKMSGGGADAVLGLRDAIKSLNAPLEAGDAAWRAYIDAANLDAVKGKILAGFKEIEEGADPDFILKGIQKAIDNASGPDKQALQTYFDGLKQKFAETGTITPTVTVEPQLVILPPEGFAPGSSGGETQRYYDAIAQSLPAVQQEVNVAVTATADPVSTATANTVIENLTADRMTDIYFQTHGYNEIERIINQLTRDRTVQITLATSTTTSGNGTAAGASRAAVTSQISYGPSFELRDVHIEAADPGELMAGIERLSRRRRLAGLPL